MLLASFKHVMTLLVYHALSYLSSQQCLSGNEIVFHRVSRQSFGRMPVRQGSGEEHLPRSKLSTFNHLHSGLDGFEMIRSQVSNGILR